MNRNLGATRAVLRLARRDAWRHRGRSALIALMVALPVLSISAVSVIYRSNQREGRDWVSVRLGDRPDAQAWIGASGMAPIAQTVDGSAYQEATGLNTGLNEQQSQARVSAALPAGDRLLVDRNRYGNGAIQLRGRTLSVALRAVDYTDPGIRGLITQQSGRAPQAPDEVVASARLARLWHLHPGDRLGFRGATGVVPITVVGVVGGTSLIGEPQLIGRPGSVLMSVPADPRHPTAPAPLPIPNWLVIGPAGVDWAGVRQLNVSGFDVTSRAVVASPPPHDQVNYHDYRKWQDNPVSAATGLQPASAVGVVIVAIGLILLQIALLAGPAIAVGARRNERTLALISVSGGDRRQVGAVVLAGTGLIGLVACTIAAVLGAGVGALTVPLLRRYGNQQLVRIDVHPLDLLVLVAVGTFTALAAALIPARQAARLDLVAVLTGRRLRLRRSRWVPVAGALVTVLGSAICYLAAVRGRSFTTIFGIAVAEVGLVALTGSIVTLAARVAPRLPFAARFALRDAARQRSRTAPAVAAVMAAVAGSVAVGVYLTSNNAADLRNFRPQTAIGAVDVRFFPGQSVPANGKPPVIVPIRPDQATAAVAALRRTLPVRKIAVYQSVSDGHISLLPPGAWMDDPTGLGDPRLFGSQDPPGQGFFDDGSATEIRTGTSNPAFRAALQAGRVVTGDPRWLWPDGTVHVRVDYPRPGAGDLTVHTVKLPATALTSGRGLAYPIFPPSVAALLGVPISPAGIAVTDTRPTTAAEQARAAAAVRRLVDSDLTVQPAHHSHNPISLLAVLAAALVITLGGTFTAVGLAATESRGDVATLAAVGAGPGVRRRLAAAAAGVITVLGAGLGLLTGLLAGWALVRVPDARYRAIGDGPPGLEFAYHLGWPFVVPWGSVALLVLGVPLLAVLIGFATTRSRLPLIRRLGQ